MKILISILFVLPIFLFAQNGKKYITHTVEAKESLSSIGRKYNITAKNLAAFNNIDYTQGLVLGQIINIPIINKPKLITADVKPKTPIKPAQQPQTSKETNEIGTPIYHTVGEKETLYHISTLYNKVPIDNIKLWNNLTTNDITQGTQIIVGYSKSADVTTKPKPKEISKPIIAEPITTKSTISTEGFFKPFFVNNKSKLVNEQGAVGVFKSNSGWDDYKFYCLHNTAPSGTIIKITNANGKSVYAKVLDMIPDIKQNAGIIIRISNAAADALGILEENKSICTLNY